MTTQFVQEQLNQRPVEIRKVALPHDQTYALDGKEVAYYPSPNDWRNEVLYFLLPDRFSDGREQGRKLLDRSAIAGARPSNFRFDKWAEGGGARWQGGKIAGITGRLGYLADLGITSIWVGPIWKQRRHENSYHGYAIQNWVQFPLWG